MSQVIQAFLDSVKEEGTKALRDLIAQMKEESVTKLVLTDHPTYELELGIAGTDLGEESISSPVTMIEDFGDRFSLWLQQHREDEDQYIDKSIQWPWIRACWLAAGGRESGCIVALHDNLMGETIDLNTGKEPDSSLGFDEFC